ncbi:hypothetical protein [Anatilimnocola floriformis]|uniref:hypothetical protein n=1 Tax=Anatilimnocola floriformis TaxID=2948575 RepID=UPI0020C367D4|nr:hypothetical protein [Anatilimnocola floriformis]
MFGSSENLVIVTGSHVAIATTRGRAVRSFASQQREPNADVVMAVEAALSLAPSRLGKIWLLVTDVWSQPITIAADVARRIPAGRLAQFVCFEVEPLSGIAPPQGAAGVVSLPTTGRDPSFWVTEIDRTLLEQLSSLIESRGGKLAGLLHPAGAPQPILQPTQGQRQWQRIELWPDAVVCLAGTIGRAASRRVFSLNELDWERDAGTWFGVQLAAHSRGDAASEPSLEVLTAGFGQLPTIAQGPRATVVSLDDAAQLQAWAGAWAGQLTVKDVVPIVTLPKPPMSARSKTFATAGLAAALLAICVSHYQFASQSNRQTVSKAQTETDLLTERQTRMQETVKEVNELRADQAKLQASQAKLVEEVALFKAATADQKKRIPELLKTLAEACSEQVLVHKIESDGRNIRVRGRCVAGQQADQLAEAIARKFAPYGLAVSLPDKQALKAQSDGGPHEFTFIISEAPARNAP